MDVLVALAILFGVQLGISRYWIEGPVDFSLYGFQLWLGGMTAWFVTQMVAALCLQRGDRIGRMLVVSSMSMAAGSVLVVVLFVQLLSHLSDPYLAYWSYVLIGLLPVYVALSKFFAVPKLRHGLIGLCVAAAGTLQVLLTEYQFESGQLLVEAETATDGEEARRWSLPDPEVVYPVQEKLVNAQVAALKEQDSEQVDLYAVLGAGYPTQKIFQREVVALYGLLEQRFGAEGRILRLGSTVQGPLDMPLLNRTNLRAALMGLSEQMDVSQDVALIFLTSHGFEDHLSTSFPGLSRKELSAAEVAAALDHSGIQNAVVVVSACYSGSFVDELAGSGRLIVTASAADRNSFGCDDSNEFTDWGEAFFGQALQETLHFGHAAERARSLVTKREKDSGLTQSLPQISEGEGIGDVLNRLAEQLKHPQEAAEVKQTRANLAVDTNTVQQLLDRLQRLSGD